jgi:predicted deacetylase
LIRADALLQECGAAKASYLLIPDYHGTGRSDLDSEFLAWCQAPRTFQVNWLLHGYYHIAAKRPDQISPTLCRRVAERFQTNGEAEFLRLTSKAQRERIENGCDVFVRCFGQRPRGFVAPAWLFNDHLVAVLRDAGFDYTENHSHIFDLSNRSTVRSPVITWATRTAMRKHGSVAFAPLLSLLWSRQPLLRVAIHPFDLDHPNVVASIRTLLTSLLSVREAYASAGGVEA